MAEPDMRGKIAVVTGATGGIGSETARGLARLGAGVVLVGRNQEKLDAVRARLEADSANDRTRCEVESLVADLASHTDIRGLAAAIHARHDHVDVLVNNAGLMRFRRRTTVDGYEMVFAVNHLAPYLLTNLLRGPLEAAPAGRVVTVSSVAHTGGRLRADRLGPETSCNGWYGYCRSKLMNVLFTRALDLRLQGTNVSANCLHPGVVDTGLFPLPRVLRPLSRLVLITPEHGAQTSIWLASSPDVEGVSGQYAMGRMFVRTSPRAEDASLAEQLWDVSAQLTRPDVPL